MTKIVYKFNAKGTLSYIGHAPEDYELREGEHFYHAKVLPKKLNDDLVINIISNCMTDIICRNKKDLNIYYDKNKTSCLVDCCSYGMLLNIELHQENVKIFMYLEGKYAQGKQYCGNFKLEEIIDDNNQNE